MRCRASLKTREYRTVDKNWPGTKIPVEEVERNVVDTSDFHVHVQMFQTYNLLPNER